MKILIYVKDNSKYLCAKTVACRDIEYSRRKCSKVPSRFSSNFSRPRGIEDYQHHHIIVIFGKTLIGEESGKD